MDTGSGRKILIIEDESDVADLLEMGLHKAGFKTTPAGDGAWRMPQGEAIYAAADSGSGST